MKIKFHVLSSSQSFGIVQKAWCDRRRSEFFHPSLSEKDLHFFDSLSLCGGVYAVVHALDSVYALLG